VKYLCAILACLLKERGQVGVASKHIDPPEYNVLRMDQVLRISSYFVRPVVGFPSRTTCSGTDGLIEFQGSHCTKKSARCVTLDYPHGAGVMVGEDRLTTKLIEDAAESMGDLIECCFPGDRFESTLSLRSAASHRFEQPIRLLLPFRITSGLNASKPAGDWMRRVSFEPDDFLPVDFYVQSASVRAIQCTDRWEYSQRWVLIH